MKSYSQNGEDNWIYSYLKKNNINVPKLIIDIGALDGITNSNSRFFLEKGWNGILFEPNPISFYKLYQNSKPFLNSNKLQIYNVAISNDKGINGFEIVTRPNFHGHSNLNEKSNYNVITLPLSFFVKNDKKVGIIDIDAEGHDTKILNHIINDTNIRSELILIESATKKDFQDQSLILKKEYEMLVKIKYNSIWKKIH